MMSWPGAGADVFVFTDNMGHDRINDFLTTSGDLLDLSTIDANANIAGNQAFTFVGSNYLKAAGQLGVYVDRANGKTYVQGDLNGDGKYDISILLNGVHNVTADDFLL